MRHTAALVILCVLVGLPWHAAADGDRIFGDRFVGDGVWRRNADWGDDLYPVNIRNVWGCINQRGDLIIVPRYEWSDNSYGGLVRVVLGKRTGFINDRDEFVIDPVYTYADRFEEGAAIVGNGQHYGFINRSGMQTVPYDLDGALRFRERLAAVERRRRCGFIDRAGKQVIPLRFGRVRSFHEGLAMVEEPGGRGGRGRLGYINRTGEFEFVDDQRRFEDLGSFADGLAPAKVGDKWGFIDRKFEIVVEPQFDAVRGFAGGLAAVKQGGKWGYIEKIKKDKKNQNKNDAEEPTHDTAIWRPAIEPTYERAYDFDEVLALVRLNGKHGFIDRDGKAVITPQFDKAQPFFRDLAWVSQPPNFGYIDIEGNIVWDPRGPADGVFDLTDLSRSRNPPRMTLPQPRRAVRSPYPPDYLYEDVLPKP